MAGADVDAIWRRFGGVTRARLGLGRSGDALPTVHALDFQYAHARARDAVGARLDFERLAAALAPLDSIRVRSAAPDRATYLRRPDLGRRLSTDGAEALPQGPYDAVFVVADGLSALAAQQHAAPTLRECLTLLDGWTIGPLVLAEQARVALGDPIGARMRAGLVVVLIGERPGLTVQSSLGAYLTHGPRVGRRDSERNCVSNIHADGLTPAAAAQRIVWLMSAARNIGLTGVALKEDAQRTLTSKPLDTGAARLPCSPQANNGDDRHES